MDTIHTALENFHWLRPLWLLALIPAAALILVLWRRGQQARQWRQLIAPGLLEHLLDPATQEKRRHYLWGLSAAWLLACIALAGPSWEKRPMPVHKTENALIIVLDLSPSMLAEDLAPSRLVRARLKIADVLRERQEGFTGLIAYAGDAHVVSPLTDDTATIRSLLNALHPNVMPVPGSRPEAAFEQAKALFSDAGISEGQILLLTDGVVDKAVNPILDQLGNTGFRLSILGIGTSEGAPIPNDRGGFERDRQGNIVVARLEQDRLERLAGRTGGRYERIDASADDVQWLLEQPRWMEGKERQLDRQFDTWYDRGHWLVLLLLPIVLYSFRRGLLVLVIALPLAGLLPQPVQAADWRAPFLTPDQRGARALEDSDPAGAAEHFQNPEWRGSALYRAEDYAAAAEAFAQSDSARAHYNRGNALAKAGDLDGAIDAYDQALEKDPTLEDARANKALVEQLKQQQEQQEQQQNSDDSQDGDNDAEESGQNKQDSQSEQDGESQSPSENESSEDNEQNASEENPSDSDRSDSQDDDKPQRTDTESPSPEDQDNGSEQEQTPPGQQDQDGQESEQETTAATLQEGDISDEERQSMEQWLRQVPDDPGGLLRRKFEYQSQQRRLQQMRGETEGQGTEERW
ncbi:VWA domain-containing protein [Marinimicrobium sp. C6131]|uniref:VWA domain-containing protein n=1 Tax=Marinimicrobium sp. C6131 TaxID=3022676 RepID=UPI00223D15E3|nr:VWA domain-containing protein [Marinimicrobium sp. C6131]UZJ45551.1 VWA domain-containing protein [Marinimicrobium sp. C6131]